MNRKEARLEDYLFLIGKLTDDRFGASSVFEVQPTIGITILAAPTDIISSSLYICFTYAHQMRFMGKCVPSNIIYII